MQEQGEGDLRNKDVTLPHITHVQTCYLYLKSFDLSHEKEFNPSLTAVSCHYCFMVISGHSNTVV